MVNELNKCSECTQCPVFETMVSMHVCQQCANMPRLSNLECHKIQRRDLDTCRLPVPTDSWCGSYHAGRQCSPSSGPHHHRSSPSPSCGPYGVARVQSGPQSHRASMGSTWPGCAQANDTCLHSSGSEANTSGRVERNSSDPDTATCVEYAKTVPGYHICLWRFYAVLRM